MPVVSSHEFPSRHVLSIYFFPLTHVTTYPIHCIGFLNALSK
jgi:hypothetical protein